MLVARWRMEVGLYMRLGRLCLSRPELSCKVIASMPGTIERLPCVFKSQVSVGAWHRVLWRSCELH